MDFLKYLLIAVLCLQVFYAGLLPAIVGLATWSIVWAPIVLTHNLIFPDTWNYLGFWAALWSWDQSTWTDLIHANVGAGLASIYALAMASSKNGVAEDASLGGTEKDET